MTNLTSHFSKQKMAPVQSIPNNECHCPKQRRLRYMSKVLFPYVNVQFMSRLCPYTCSNDPDPVCSHIYDSHYYLLNCFHDITVYTLIVQILM